MSYSIFYWAVAYFNYDKQGDSEETFKGLAILCMGVILLYMVVRCYFNRVAGAYMVKRIIYASILGSSY
jgi:hypothetical protein